MNEDEEIAEFYRDQNYELNKEIERLRKMVYELSEELQQVQKTQTNRNVWREEKRLSIM